MNSPAITFTDSLESDSLEAENEAHRVRRLSTYTVLALRAAVTLERVYVKHPQFVAAVGALDRAFQLGTELQTPLGFRLVGPPGVGKSSVYSYFRNSLPPSSLFDQDGAALAIRLPRRPTSGMLIRALLRAVKYPFSEGSHKQLDAKRAVVFDALRSHGTRLLWIDEAHRLIWRKRNGSFRDDEGDASELLASIIDDCHCGVVLAGTNQLDDLPAALEHLASRIPGRLTLEPFELSPSWAGFIHAFSASYEDVNLEVITTPSVMTALHKATAGNLRLFRQLLIEAVLLSVDAGVADVDISGLGKAYDVVCGTSKRSNPFVA